MGGDSEQVLLLLLLLHLETFETSCCSRSRTADSRWDRKVAKPQPAKSLAGGQLPEEARMSENGGLRCWLPMLLPVAFKLSSLNLSQCPELLRTSPIRFTFL